MNQTSQKIYDELIDTLGRRCEKLTPHEYKEVLDGLASHLDGLIGCWEEEHAED